MNVKKIIEKMNNQPNGIKIEEAQKVLYYYGYKLDRQKGSHKHYINGNGNVITIVNKMPLPSYIVKDILERINERK